MRIPLSSAVVNIASETYLTHVTSPSCPGRVSITPLSWSFCDYVLAIDDSALWKERTAMSHRAIKFDDPKAIRDDLEMAATCENLLVDAAMYAVLGFSM